ncbi:hypothetical protein CVT25_002256 [Psilocybe cyanescens]|uniref:Uncharacterized protein n=1 Tax=Psilocybe cyanescens TaxID=93625 RepID=A0A409XWD8_PSICY|nr:hypothetical protein CVT25_002256 [Psilocybe cyanescens]
MVSYLNCSRNLDSHSSTTSLKYSTSTGCTLQTIPLSIWAMPRIPAQPLSNPSCTGGTWVFTSITSSLLLSMSVTTLPRLCRPSRR